MGPELLAAIVGPLIAGTVSIVIWIGNRNGNRIDNGFSKLQTTIERIDIRIDNVDQKVDDLKDNVAKNYVTNSRFEDHIDLQSSMQARMVDEISRMREEAKEGGSQFRKHAEVLRDDIAQIKEMQWKTRLGLLDLIDRKLRRAKHELEDDDRDDHEGHLGDVWSQ
jgi:chromosome segregation ATPase